MVRKTAFTHVPHEPSDISWISTTGCHGHPTLHTRSVKTDQIRRFLAASTSRSVLFHTRHYASPCHAEGPSTTGRMKLSGIQGSVPGLQ